MEDVIFRPQTVRLLHRCREDSATSAFYDEQRHEDCVAGQHTASLDERGGEGGRENGPGRVLLVDVWLELCVCISEYRFTYTCIMLYLSIYK